ncbi:MAG: V-type ATPase subunit [Coriobacteriia bacterium]|nr:V-type ATPase subunit [Coriobacteriia bacterium]
MISQSALSTIEYANARVRSHRARLFKQADYDDMMGQASLEQLRVYLGFTKYASDIEENSLTRTGASVVGFAVNSFLQNEFEWVSKFYTTAKRRLIDAIAGEWDFADLKTVVRGIYSGTSPEEIIASFSGAGIVISREALSMLAKQKSLQDAVALASTLNFPYANALRLGAERFAITEALVEFEASLDQAYFAWALGLLDHRRGRNSVVYTYIREKIDIRNIMTLARVIVSNETFGTRNEAARYFLIGGTAVTDAKMFARLAALPSLEDLARALGTIPLRKVIRSEIAEYLISDSLSELDRALNLYSLRKVVKIGHRDLAGVGLPIAYLLALENETIDIRIIAYAKAYGIPDSMIREEIALV